MRRIDVGPSIVSCPSQDQIWKTKQDQPIVTLYGYAVSSGFHMGNGTRQGGTLSPYLFSRYIREFLGAVSGTAAGCYIGNHCFNILAYADDLVVLAPSWRVECFTRTVFVN